MHPYLSIPKTVRNPMLSSPSNEKKIDCAKLSPHAVHAQLTALFTDPTLQKLTLHDLNPTNEILDTFSLLLEENGAPLVALTIKYPPLFKYGQINNAAAMIF